MHTQYEFVLRSTDCFLALHKQRTTQLGTQVHEGVRACQPGRLRPFLAGPCMAFGINSCKEPLGPRLPCTLAAASELLKRHPSSAAQTPPVWKAAAEQDASKLAAEVHKRAAGARQLYATIDSKSSRTAFAAC